MLLQPKTVVHMVVPLENLVTKPNEGVISGSANALTSKVERLQANFDR